MDVEKRISLRFRSNFLSDCKCGLQIRVTALGGVECLRANPMQTACFRYRHTFRNRV